MRRTTLRRLELSLDLRELREKYIQLRLLASCLRYGNERSGENEQSDSCKREFFKHEITDLTPCLPAGRPSSNALSIPADPPPQLRENASWG